MLDAVHAIVWQLCVKGDETASELTRELHFRSQVRTPAPPSERPVDSSKPFASAQLKSVLTEGDTEERDRLLRFGRALHGWQDTFSHQGVPSAPRACPADWVWAHPEDRHGATSHKADLTHVYPDDCLEAARTSYEALLAYRRARNLPLAGPDWSLLKPRAVSFCKAATKTEKADWLKAEKVPQADAIAKNTTLRNGKRRFFGAPRIDLGESVPRGTGAVPMYETQAVGFARDPEVDRMVQSVLSRPIVQTAPDARQWFDDFFGTWLSTPPSRLARAMSPFLGAMPLQATSPAVQTLLRMRVADRSRADAASGETVQLLSQPREFVTATPSTWPSLLVPVRGRGEAVLVGNVSDDGAVVAAIAVLRHAPYEVLVVKAERQDGSFRATTVDAFVFH
jgi:hypothetical protein